MYGLDAAAWPWKPIPWSSLHTVLELIWRPREVWRSVVIDSSESWRPLCTMHLSIRWLHSVILGGLPLGWVTVIPNRFHFVIIPMTVDCGIFRSEEISRLDLLHRWHPITVPRWNSLRSWETHILSQMFVETVCMPRCLILYIGGHGSDWTHDFNYLDGWVNTFSLFSLLAPLHLSLCLHSLYRSLDFPSVTLFSPLSVFRVTMFFAWNEQIWLAE